MHFPQAVAIIFNSASALMTDMTDDVARSGRERLKPSVDQAAGQVQPMTEDITRDVIRPGGEKISKNAVPVTKQIAEEQIQPAVDQVVTIS